MTPSPSSQIYLSHGRVIALGEKIGSGGEGEVYSIPAEPRLAAKVYYPKQRSEREQKIKAMLIAGVGSKDPLVAFPKATLEDQLGRFVGFLMPRVTDALPVFMLSNLSIRREKIPGIGFDFIVHASKNLARAVAQVHQSGCVIGDLNQSGFLVNRREALVHVIDADSFQITIGGADHLCVVRRPEYLAPELVGFDLARVRREKNHDVFALAVLLFELLFMGRHPFSGTGPAREVGENIRLFDYAFSQARKTSLKPPRGAPPVEIVGSKLAALFELSFGPPTPGRGRPSAADWVEALEQYARALVPCRQGGGHFYLPPGPWSSGAGCPWCRLELSTGVQFFPGVPRAAFSASTSGAPNKAGRSIDERAHDYRSKLASLNPPLRLTPALPTIVPDPSSLARARELASRAQRPSWLAKTFRGQTYNSPPDDLVKSLADATREVSTAWKEALQRVDLPGLHIVHAKLSALVDAREAAEMAAKNAKNWLNDIEVAAAVVAFVSRILIRDANVSGISDSNIDALSSIGIVTASDVLRTDPKRARGIGAVKAATLSSWAEGELVRARSRFSSTEDPVKNATILNQLLEHASVIDSQIGPLFAELERRQAAISQLVAGRDVAVNRAMAIHAAWLEGWRLAAAGPSSSPTSPTFELNWDDKARTTKLRLEIKGKLESVLANLLKRFGIEAAIAGPKVIAGNASSFVHQFGGANKSGAGVVSAGRSGSKVVPRAARKRKRSRRWSP